ncbi:hypothetical protein E5K00_16565 [Hymenobacter aquaticus]|uniref:DUF5683 domain-containing protein n=1 Tax=Hymenobacter aquaticus TaxID=1867101 RepID=A0A4Z0PX83_9BACT|nr:hypothetical protein [Hymenobacter aquaticus]TGE21876.1 hypothetical protein E5K00_16565 [Hymenobacter aquaticus]
MSLLRVSALSLGLSLSAAAAFAQQAPTQQVPYIRLSPEDQARGLNGAQRNFFFTTGESTREEDYVNAGFFGQRLRPYLANNPEALANLNAYRAQKWLFLGERLTFVGAVAFYSQQVLSGDGEQQYFKDTQKAAIGVATLSLLSNIFITRHTNERFQRAVSAHNAGLSSAHSSMLQRLTPATIGLAAAQNGQPLLALRWNVR